MRVLLLLTALLPLVQDMQMIVSTAALCRSLLAAWLCNCLALLYCSCGGYFRGSFFIYSFQNLHTVCLQQLFISVTNDHSYNSIVDGCSIALVLMAA